MICNNDIMSVLGNKCMKKRQHIRFE